MTPTPAMSEKDLSMDFHNLSPVIFDNNEMDVEVEYPITPSQNDYDLPSSESPILLTQNLDASCGPLQPNSTTAFPNKRGPGPTVAVQSVPPCSSGLAISDQCSAAPSTRSLEDCADDLQLAQPEQVMSSAPRTESTAINFNDDSLDASDAAFSQELVLSPTSSSASGGDTESISDFETEVTNAKLHSLCPAKYLASSGRNIIDSGSNLCEDIYSRIYHDYDDERFSRGHWNDVDEEERRTLSGIVTAEELEAREQVQRNGGLANWNYDSPFADVSVRIDDVNNHLEKRFLTEANTALDKVIADIASRASRINACNKNDLQGMLTAFGRGLELRAAKAELLSAVFQLKEDIKDNLVDLNANPDHQGTTEDQQSQSSAKSLKQAFRESSLTAWVMKPLVSTAGMREGSRNEVELLKSLHAYCIRNKGAYRRKLGCCTYAWDETFVFNINHVRCTGLLEIKSCSMMADSPDAILVASDIYDTDHVSAVEIKTMAAVGTVEASTILRHKYGPFVSLENVGMDEKSTELFRELVPTSEYRAQVLHHAATLGINSVLFVVGTGGSMTEGRIL